MTLKRSTACNTRHGREGLSPPAFAPAGTRIRLPGP
jgi:hypothetical protein